MSTQPSTVPGAGSEPPKHPSGLLEGPSYGACVPHGAGAVAVHADRVDVTGQLHRVRGDRGVVGEHRARLVALAAKARLPAMYSQREYVDDGGLMSYGSDRSDSFRRSAHYVDKILKGAKPADLPVQQATKFEFVINLKAAKQIGVTIPPRVLERANQVIK